MWWCCIVESTSGLESTLAVLTPNLYPHGLLGDSKMYHRFPKFNVLQILLICSSLFLLLHYPSECIPPSNPLPSQKPSSHSRVCPLPPTTCNFSPRMIDSIFRRFPTVPHSLFAIALLEAIIFTCLDHCSSRLTDLSASLPPPSHLSPILSPEGCCQHKSCIMPFVALSVPRHPLGSLSYGLFTTW